VIDYESPSAHTFLALARRRSEADAARCGLVFAQLGAAARLRNRLREALTPHDLRDLDFATLVVLFAGEPEAIPMAVLAEQTAVSRSAMTDTLDTLERLQLATRTRDRSDRRILRVRITAAGREAIGRAIGDYLHAATHDAISGDDARVNRAPARRL
jgi:DNA-binding MarR family transcriptional regulator